MKATKTKILTVGGGSGGHVTPVVAVINQLVANHAQSEIRFWSDRGYRKQAASLIKEADTSVHVSAIFAGKLRRYHGSTLVQKLIDVPTNLHNIFDIFLVILGFLQSFVKLIIWRPDVIFLKGGFVCLPVGYAAFLLRIPFVIHDSDAHAGLANRLVSPLATYIATGMPLEYYSYPKQKSSYVGIPVKSSLRPLSKAEADKIKSHLGFETDKPMLVVTGGGLGAKRINDALVAIAPELIKHTSIVHLSGARQYDELKDKVPKTSSYKLISFVSDNFADLVGAADVVISRAGASTLAELAAVGANVILVPNPQLVGGHQIKNAKVYTGKGAVEVADETKFTSNPRLLLEQILDLLEHDEKRNSLGRSLRHFTRLNAADDVAKLIMKAAGDGS
ncbi:UDP-N-acetylglucosamine--N-acetylmuramyl-(pentapeptide) pyrophosphoryl-undecaprenol N-acetylglucosamine transferase [Candidatus Saccharibacteria bacterium]|nr:UDP-N-acetylglucosamine--N-acetylmuramyl-(pentapeptide) pyrophosphoryl-undecaprenol N-acetylglucosamine transferase [Candidatus Saccharibacteria bacterium]